MLILDELNEVVKPFGLAFVSGGMGLVCSLTHWEDFARGIDNRRFNEKVPHLIDLCEDNGLEWAQYFAQSRDFRYSIKVPSVEIVAPKELLFRARRVTGTMNMYNLEV